MPDTELARAAAPTTLCRAGCGTRVTASGLLREQETRLMHTPDRCRAYRAANGEGAR